MSATATCPNCALSVATYTSLDKKERMTGHRRPFVREDGTDGGRRVICEQAGCAVGEHPQGKDEVIGRGKKPHHGFSI